MRRIILLTLGLLILLSAYPGNSATEEEHPDITPLIEALKYPDQEFRYWVVRTLAKAGEVSIPVLTDLVLDENNNVQKTAIRCLRKFGVKADPAHDNLVKALSDDDLSIRLQAASALSRIGPYAKEAVPTLIECLSSEDGLIMMEAVEILGDIGPEAADALPYILEKASYNLDGNRVLTVPAVYAVSYIGQDAEGLEDYIIPLLKSERSGDDYVAVQALKRLRSKAPGFIEFLISVLDGQNNYSLNKVLEILGDIGPPAAEAIPSIRAIIEERDQEAYKRCQGIETLPKIGAGQEVMDILMIYVDDTELVIRLNAIWALGKIRPTPEGLVDTLMGMLTNEDEFRVRDAICTALGDIGLRPKDVIPLLIEAVRPRWFGGPPGMWAVEALATFGPDAKDATPVLVETLDYMIGYQQYGDKYWKEIIDTIYALGDIGPAAKEALPKLYELLENGRQSRRPALYYAIACIEGDAADAIPNLITFVEAEGTYYHSVLRVIGKLGPKASCFVDDIVAEFWEINPMHHQQLAEVLGNIGPAAAPAIDNLRIIARTYPEKRLDDYYPLRDTVLDAIAKIEGRWPGDG